MPAGACTITLMPGSGSTLKRAGSIDDLIGSSEGVVVTSSKGTAYLALAAIATRLRHTRCLCGATIIYPKDAALIMASADIGRACVLEAGAGSGALSCWLLRGVTPTGHPHLRGEAS